MDVDGGMQSNIYDSMALGYAALRNISAE